jgi:predicted transcriptional regulator
MGEDAAAVIVKGERKDFSLNEMGSLSEKQREVMSVLDGLGDDGLPATEIIACAEGLSTATVYRQLNSLVKEEYIVKKAGLYSLTDKGQDALDANTGGDE